nr:glycosyltransferase [Prochlorococcus marinus]
MKSRKVIFAEFPSYPYRRILSKHNEFKYKIAFLLDSFCLPFVKYAYTYALNIGSNRNILGLKTLFISNGIDIDSYKSKKNNFNTNKKRLNFLFIGNLINYHGLDRLINGISIFLEQKGELLELNLDIISSDTDEYKRLKNLVNSLRLNKYINFISGVYNKQLNYYYDKADIGLSALAWHRVDITFPSNIKSREYCVFGLPYLYSGKDPLINNKFKYAFQVPGDNSPIDIMKILKFKNLIYANKQFPEKMKSFAAKSLNWEYAMNNFLKLLLIENQN